MSGDPGRRDTGVPEVGSLAEEATKLWGALAGWARDHSPDLGHGISDIAAQAAAGAHEANDHLATEDAECTVCPVCRALHAVRGLSPEVRSHLGAAVTSLGQAASAFLSTQPPGSGEGDDSRRGETSPVDGDVDA